MMDDPGARAPEGIEPAGAPAIGAVTGVKEKCEPGGI